jgi:hypothetical protein
MGLSEWIDRMAGRAVPVPTPQLGGTDVIAELETRREEAHTRQQEAKRSAALRENTGAISLPFGQSSIDNDDHLFRRLTGGGSANRHRRDLSPLAHDRMLEIAWYLWEQNAFARRLITLMTDLLLGEGITIEAEDERVQEAIDAMWEHRVNQLKGRIREFYASLALSGELILPTTTVAFTGRPILGYIDPYNVLAVIPLPDNVLVPDKIVLKGTDGREGEVLKVIRESPATGRLEGDCFYFAINKLPNSLRGRSDLLPLADWLDLYDQYMFSEVERLHLLSSFVWDYELKGQTKEQIQKRADEFPQPKPGTVWLHNENERLEPRVPSLQGGDRSEVARLLRVHIAGSFGFPLSYLGDSDGGNRATMEGQNDILLKTPAARQREFAGFIDQIVRFSIEKPASNNPSLFNEASFAYTIQMPEIAAKDIARVGGVLAQVAQAMDTSINNETFSKKSAQSLMVALSAHLGVDVDLSRLREEIEEESQEKAEKFDLMQAAMNRARAENGNQIQQPGVAPPGAAPTASAGPKVDAQPSA